jgi:hypothetical protein
VLSLFLAKFLIAANINVTLTPINDERLAHEGFGDDGLALVVFTRLLACSNG